VFHDQELRSPHDVINLGRLLHFPQDSARDAVMQMSEEAVAHGNTRSQVDKGVLRKRIKKLPESLS